MIVLNLTCAHGHTFEGWFPSSEAFEQQCRDAMINCTVCASTEISRLPSSPRINKGDAVAVPTQRDEELTKAAIASAYRMLTQLADGSEDVSDRFPDEARKIHYGDAEPRSIKGKASLEETLDLLEEGVPILPLVKPEDETH